MAYDWGKPTEQSLRKINLVTSYFKAWLTVMLSNPRGEIAYIDLFSGPGLYNDKTESTPVKIVRTILEQPKELRRIRLRFNDKDAGIIKRLKRNLEGLPNFSLLSEKVFFDNYNISKGFPLHLIPRTQALSYLDPYGIEGLTLDLFKSCIDGFGKDMIIFFSYDHINRFFDVEPFNKHISMLFGVELAGRMSQELKILPSAQREGFIIDSFINVLKSVGAEYVLPYRMIRSNSERTGHYIVFASKHYLGRRIMADIMKSETEGVDTGLFGFNPKQDPNLLLFEFYKVLPNLNSELEKDFTGCRLTVRKIFEEHSKKTYYTEKEYRDALKALEIEDRILVQRPSPRSPKGSFAESAIITFK